MYMEHNDDGQRCDLETDSTASGRRDNTTPGTVKSDVPAGMGVLGCPDSKGGHFCRCVGGGGGGVDSRSFLQVWVLGWVLTVGHFCSMGVCV